MSKRKKCEVLAWRKRVRTMFSIFSAVGFVYQSITFVQMYLEYPSIVELEVDQPTELELPAITVCNVNEIRSSAYCEQHSENCKTPEESANFCVLYPEYCKLVNISKKVPTVDVYSFRNLSRREQQVLGHKYDDFITECKIEMNEIKKNCSEPMLVTGMSFNQVPFNCYMVNSLHGKPSESPEMISTTTNTLFQNTTANSPIDELTVSSPCLFSALGNLTHRLRIYFLTSSFSTVSVCINSVVIHHMEEIHMALNLEVAEYHPSHLSRGAQISIHTPYHIPSPKNEGLFLNLGNIYRMSVRLSDKNLLPDPFKSNCTDYISIWKANGGMGPVTEKMCKEKCKLDKSLSMHQCADYRIDFPHNDTFCPQGVPGFTSSIISQCDRNCASPCKIRRFDIEVHEANSEGSRKSCLRNRKNDRSCFTFVYITFENLEITTFTYKPRFEPIGILGYIGGYVGLWLGISLLTVYDFFDSSIFQLCSKIRRKVRLKEMKRRKMTQSVVSPPRRNTSSQLNRSMELRERLSLTSVKRTKSLLLP